MSAQYGKLSPVGNKWKDSYSSQEVTSQEVEEAVKRAQQSRW